MRFAPEFESAVMYDDRVVRLRQQWVVAEEGMSCKHSAQSFHSLLEGRITGGSVCVHQLVGIGKGRQPAERHRRARPIRLMAAVTI